MFLFVNVALKASPAELKMEIQHFLLEHFIQEEFFHLARVKIYSSQDLSIHDHNYAEIFWIEQGQGTHLINGKEVALQPGNLVMMRPEDYHSFASTKHGITIMNIAFPSETLDVLRNRYFPESQIYFWTKGELPYQIKLDMTHIKTISQNAERIWKYRHSRLYLDSFLLMIFKVLDNNITVSTDPNQLPSWLSLAIEKYFAREHFAQGSRGFVHLCDRNKDYVNRVIQKHYKKTLSQLVNDLKLNYAARQLVITHVPIKTICLDCGFRNLGYFYKIFQQSYHCTPAQYRYQHQTIV